ncbi:MAG: hypothetical protein NVSMB51_11680 [Solirubrobacteraceae bacterium]
MTEQAQGIWRRSEQANARERERQRRGARVGGRMLRCERRDAGNTAGDRCDRRELTRSGALAEQPLGGHQQHRQAERQRRLHDDQRRERKCEDLQRPAEDRHRRAGEPAAAAQQCAKQRRPQPVAGIDGAGVECLDCDP